MRILISAGEASGEMYGAQLIDALRKLDPSLEFFGVGGERMRNAGCETIVDSKELAVVGITEILHHLPRIWGLFHKLIAEVDRRKPALAVVIDSPAFNWRVACQMRKRGIPVVYYVCPQFWAWRQGRVRLLRKYVDQALVIFPFEEKFYRDRGVNATFVGHPLAGLPRPSITREQYAAQNGLDEEKFWIVLMPGSRKKEVRMNLPEMVRAAGLLGDGYEFLMPVASTLDREFLESLTEDGPQIHFVTQALPALAHARAGIIASGTATVEAAIMGTPFVMVYRVSSLTYALGKSQVKVPYFAMVNLIAGRAVVSELVQDAFTASAVAGQVKHVIPEGPARAEMIAALREVKQKLAGSEPGGLPAPERAALLTAELLEGKAA